MTYDAVALQAVVAALFGLAVGSFATVVIWRVPRGRSVVRPGSACFACGTAIPARQNIPVVAWAGLGGRARCCGARIPLMYPAVEASTALLWAFLAVTTEPAWLLVSVLPFAAGAVCVTATDLACMRIPHPVTSALGVMALGGSAVIAVTVDQAPAGGGARAFWVPAACGLAAAGALEMLRRTVPQGMGRGDVRYAFSLGVVVATAAGPGALLVAMVTAFASGSVVGLAVTAGRALRGLRGREARLIPFGPHLALGALVAVLWGGQLWGAYAELLGLG